MKKIVEVKNHLHDLEKINRTSAWNYLTGIFESDPSSPEIATLCLHQMFMNMNEMEGPPPWCEPERENEYDEYYNFAQRILLGYCTTYADSAQFQWELCYYLEYYPTYHWLDGVFYLSDNYVLKLRQGLIEQFLQKHPDSMLFKYIDPIQKSERSLLLVIEDEDLGKLREEIYKWNLQDNYADREVMRCFKEIL